MLWQRKKEAQEIEFFAPFALQLFVSLIEWENHVEDCHLKNVPAHWSNYPFLVQKMIVIRSETFRGKKSSQNWVGFFFIQKWTFASRL